jgi:hypothetical protein
VPSSSSNPDNVGGARRAGSAFHWTMSIAERNSRANEAPMWRCRSAGGRPARPGVFETSASSDDG